MTEYRIERLGHKGDGIAAGPTFVPRVLPGEVVAGDVVGDRIDAPRIITPSPDRRSPPCRHYKSCGGCALQHATDEFVGKWKTEQVRTALENRAISVEMGALHTSPPRSRRRAVLHGRRTKTGVQVGLHARASETLVAIPDCQLMTPAIMSALPYLEAIVALAGSRRGEMTLAVTETSAGLDVDIAGGHPLDMELQTKLVHATSAADFARFTYAGEQITMARPPAMRFGSADVVPPAGAFLQATAAGEAALVSAMLRATEGARRVADLFSGCGTFSLPLAQGADVLAVESIPEMLAALDQAWRRTPGLKTVTTETRDLFRRPLLVDELKRFDAIVIDPPRPGAEAQCLELAKSAVPVVGFVSCNPVTFARDAAHLIAGGYVLDWVEVVDQFRWSTHVEIAARFSRP